MYVAPESIGGLLAAPHKDGNALLAKAETRVSAQRIKAQKVLVEAIGHRVEWRELSEIPVTA